MNLLICALFCVSSLQMAEDFLKANQKQKGTISLAEGKVQYHVVKKGKGEAVAFYSKPLIAYSGKYLEGSPISRTEEFLDLDETYLGFKKGLVGMKEGEVRVFYIHPELGDGKGLMIVEVEVIKADATAGAHAASNREMEKLL